MSDIDTELRRIASALVEPAPRPPTFDEIVTGGGVSTLRGGALWQHRTKFAVLATATLLLALVAVVLVGRNSTTPDVTTPAAPTSTGEKSATALAMDERAVFCENFEEVGKACPTVGPDTGRVAVMGADGVAGWVYTPDLTYPTSEEDFDDIDALNEKLRNWAAPVYGKDGKVIGYWVTNGIGFVDRRAFESPDYDPDALRAERQGTVVTP